MSDGISGCLRVRSAPRGAAADNRTRSFRIRSTSEHVQHLGKELGERFHCLPIACLIPRHQALTMMIRSGVATSARTTRSTWKLSRLTACSDPAALASAATVLVLLDSRY